jgi:HEAT repeat protein
MRTRLIGVICCVLLVILASYAPGQDSKGVKIGDLRAMLKDADAEIRKKGADGLAENYKNALPAVNDLIETLEKDNEPAVRIAAANSLRSIFWEGRVDPKGTKTIAALVKAMRQDKDALVRYMACQSLDHIGPKAHAAAVDLFEVMNADDDPFLRKLAQHALPQVASRACEGLLSKLIELHKSGPEDWTTQFAVLECMGKVSGGDEETLTLLKAALREKKPRHRMSREGAAYALGRMGASAKSAVPMLVDSINETKNGKERESGSLLLFAIQALRDIGPTSVEALPTLKGIAGDSAMTETIRRAAMQAVYAIEKPSRK